MDKRLIAAAVVLVIAATPSVTDARRAWVETPGDRWLIVGAYALALAVAIGASEILVT